MFQVVFKMLTPTMEQLLNWAAVVEASGRAEVSVQKKLNLVFVKVDIDSSPEYDTSYTLEIDRSRDIWKFNCAEHRYDVHKELLPPVMSEKSVDQVNILTVSGHYGAFEGKNAFEEYQNAYKRYHDKYYPIYQACEVVGICRHSGFRAEWFVGEVFKMIKDGNVLGVNEEDLKVAMASPILNNMYEYLDGSSSPELTLRQLASLIVALRSDTQAVVGDWKPIGL